MSKSLSGGAGSEAAMIIFRGIAESFFYEAQNRAITIMAEEPRSEAQKVERDDSDAGSFSLHLYRNFRS